MIHYIKPALCARQVLNFASGVVATKKPYIKCCTSPAAASSRRSPQCILADKPRAGAKLVGREMVYGGVREGRGVCTLAVDSRVAATAVICAWVRPLAMMPGYSFIDVKSPPYGSFG